MGVTKPIGGPRSQQSHRGGGARIASITTALFVVTVSSLLAGGDVARAEPTRSFDDRGGCPYDFQSAVPAGVFCVYEGIAVGPDGHPCAEPLVVIWSGDPAARFEVSNDVYLGFVGDPEFVVHATTGGARKDSAAVVESFIGDGKQALAGAARLQADGGREGAVLIKSLALREPRTIPEPSCRVASYRGIFIGVIGTPLEASAWR